MTRPDALFDAVQLEGRSCKHFGGKVVLAQTCAAFRVTSITLVLGDVARIATSHPSRRMTPSQRLIFMLGYSFSRIK
jgi:hypothetical protein